MPGRFFATLLLALPTVGAFAASPQESSVPAPGACCAIPDQYQQEVARAEMLGRLVYLHDKAAWLSTDALVAISAFKSPPGPMDGWVTQPADGGKISVGYLAKVAGKDLVFARADIWPEAGGVANARRLRQPEPLTPAERRVVDATKLAIAAGGSLNCSNKPFNTVAFEDGTDAGGGVLVFLMSAWTNESAPIGGYEMFRTDADAASLRERFAQTKSCISMSNADLAKASAITVGHVTSPAPTAFHVFMSLQYAKPLYVSAGDLLWVVEDGHIRIVDGAAGIGAEIRRAMESGQAE